MVDFNKANLNLLIDLKTNYESKLNVKIYLNLKQNKFQINTFRVLHSKEYWCLNMSFSHGMTSSFILSSCLACWNKNRNLVINIVYTYISGLSINASRNKIDLHIYYIHRFLALLDQPPAFLVVDNIFS